MLEFSIDDLKVWEKKGKIYVGSEKEFKDITYEVMNLAGLVVLMGKDKKYVLPWGNGTLKLLKGK